MNKGIENGGPPGPRRVWPRDLAWGILLAAAYVALGRFGLGIHAVNVFATLVWAPSGVALAALLLLGVRLWPAVTLGAFAVNLWTGAPPAVALAIAAGNTLEAVIGAWALRRMSGFRPSLDRLADVLRLAAVGAVLATTISATVGTASLAAAGIVASDRFGATWAAWWLGDAVGIVVVAPLLLTASKSRRFRVPDRGRLAEGSALALLVIAAAYSVFDRGHVALASLLAPLLLWAALRFEQRGAARAAFLVCVIAVFSIARGKGPFAEPLSQETLFALQSFLGLTAGTFLVLGTLTSERRLAEEERGRAEAVVRESEKRHRTLIDAVDQLIWINDAAGQMVYINRQWEERLGATLGDAAGFRWSSFVHPDDRTRVFSLRQRAVESGEPYHLEFRCRLRDESYRWMIARVVPIRDVDGRIESWFGSAADIQDLKMAEEELRGAKEASERANRAKDEFLAALSHELRTPLTPVLAIASVVERDPDLPDRFRRQIEVVRRNAELEATLIDDLLDLTRIARGKLEIVPEPVLLEEAIDHAVEICRPEADSKKLELRREGIDPALLVRADPARLRQILWNLLRNAVKFTPAGGRIIVRAVPTGLERVAVEVEDNGIGIAPEEIPRIFRPFEQAGPRHGGLGLGLAISNALAQAHGGTLTGTSDGPGSGATFRVELATLQPSPAGERAAAAWTAGSAAPGRRRVLFVEDHVDTLGAARELLAELSCEVVTASSIREALAAAEANPFDLVVSDLGLPDGSGLDLMRRLREVYGLAGIALTGYGMEDDVKRSREAGFVEHLVKPITFQRLESAIERFFRREAISPTP
jgi:PAS domain S-box-containing protein